jgi:DNA-directed RNA polymerase specialized sigma24 family protein
MGNDIEKLERLFLESLEGNVIAYHRFLTHAAMVIAERLDETELSTAEKEILVQEILIAVHIKRHTALAGPGIETWLTAIIQYTISKTKRRHCVQIFRAWLNRVIS